MHKSKLYSIALLFSFLFVSCSNEEGLDGTWDLLSIDFFRCDDELDNMGRIEVDANGCVPISVSEKICNVQVTIFSREVLMSYVDENGEEQIVDLNSYPFEEDNLIYTELKNGCIANFEFSL